MNEALCSILSGEDQWSFDQEGRSIKFNPDGTGELWCRCNFNYWIASELEWKSIKLPNSVRPPAQVVETASASQNKGPHFLGQLHLEITLIKRLPEWARDSGLSKGTMLNERGLTDDAFRPKSYNIRIEKGHFVEPSYIGVSTEYKTRFALRLLFDRSPYPPRSQWREPERGPDGGRFWDHKEFVGRISNELKNQGRAMNDLSPPGRNSCIVS
ncbi:hypothetical protein N431DRAFT_485870 [Stipitochalara longipes BDJ]|nr:hypothetical protein N431DRAFT_485870 [Stipitochalara longipes BDJ]